MKTLALLLLVFPNFALAEFGDDPQYLVYCSSQTTQISFDIWSYESKYEVRNLVFQNQSVVKRPAVEVINVTSMTDENSFTTFSVLQARIENGDIMTLSETQGDDYLLTIQSANHTKEYQCTVGIPKPGVIISN